ncbi:hypothetical protein [Planctomicrobium sp. SH664]|uniref:hypothetical protein n=1 Tax=Planctomicrobium sp. SH664 TaxID=3448125 RepID=UPI003F5C6D92
MNPECPFDAKSVSSTPEPATSIHWISSSTSTFYAVFPVVWYFIIFAATAAAAYGLTTSNASNAAWCEVGALSALFLLAGLPMLFLGLKIRRVGYFSASGQKWIRIAGFRSATDLPVTMIDEVRELVPMNFRPTLIRYSDPGGVKITVTLIPHSQPFLPPWKTHPDVVKLQEWVFGTARQTRSRPPVGAG